MRLTALLLPAVWCLLSVGGLPAALAEEETARTRPNVLFLFTDDQRADTIGGLGNPHIHTPTLDALARRGFVFRNAYCLGANSGAVCFPSRNMLLSGRAYFRMEQKGLASGKKPSFPASMKAAGYETYHHGKRGNTARELHQQFHHSRYLNDNQARTSGEPGQEIVDRAIEFLGQRNGQQPFFLYLAFSTPHDPRVASKKWHAKYPPGSIPLPENYLPLHPFNNGEMTVRDERLAPWPRTKEEITRHLHDYYSVITGLDYHIGRLIEHLKETGQLDSTLIVFSSDHGLAVGSHGLMGKQSLYEHSMKAPLIFAGPGIPQGQSDALVYLLDIYPTVCGLTGVEVPRNLDGHSLAPVIHGEQDSVRSSLFTAYKNYMRAVRDDRWKLIRYPHINRWQLFDLQDDPHELHDLSQEAQQQDRLTRLAALMADWQQQLGDDTPLTSKKPANPEFVPPKD